MWGLPQGNLSQKNLEMGVLTVSLNFFNESILFISWMKLLTVIMLSVW